MPIRTLRRARSLRAFDHRGSLTLLGDDGLTRRVDGDAAALVRALLEILVEPRTDDALRAHLEERTGGKVDLDGVVGEALALLQAAGAVVEAGEASVPGPAPPSVRPRRLVLAVCGAIGATNAPLLVEMLQARGFEVRVAATENALRFVSPLALEALTHHPVVSSMWPRDARVPVPHLALAEWAELVVVYPATATSLSRLARGDCSDVGAAMAISARVPVIVAPSMNGRMLTAPSVRRNLERLREDGFFVVHAGAGLEVADRPGERRPALGGAPGPAGMVEIIAAVAFHHLPPLEVSRLGAASWEAVYEATPMEDLPWFAPGLDDDTTEMLERLSPSGRLLDLGTGPGTAAIEAARRGYQVVATDLAERALALASRREGAREVTWLRDDITETALRGRFDVVHDRGCLHVLDPEAWGRYAAAVAALTRPGGWLLLKVHTGEAAGAAGTHAFTRPELEALLGADFSTEEVRESTFPGPRERAPSALLVALRRR